MKKIIVKRIIGIVILIAIGFCAARYFTHWRWFDMTREYEVYNLVKDVKTIDEVCEILENNKIDYQISDGKKIEFIGNTATIDEQGNVFIKKDVFELFEKLDSKKGVTIEYNSKSDKKVISCSDKPNREKIHVKKVNEKYYVSYESHMVIAKCSLVLIIGIILIIPIKIMKKKVPKELHDAKELSKKKLN